MTPLTDDELGDLLTETFAMHEELADPDRAVAIAVTPGRPSHRGRVLLGVAAAVALVAVGTTDVVTRGASNPPPVGVPRHVPRPPLPPLQTDAGNRNAAFRTSTRLLSRLPVYPGANETGLAVPPLKDASGPAPAPGSVGGSRFWLVTGTTARAVANWYAAHPPSGFHTVGGRNGVGGQGDGRTWVDDLTWVEPPGEVLPPVGTSAEVYTTDVSTDTATGVAIRISVGTVWNPARPRASYVQDVSSIDVRSTHTGYGKNVSTSQDSFTISSPKKALRAAVLFNDLPGLAPEPPHSCPMIRDVYTDRIVFHTATGDVTAVSTSSTCGSGMSVSRDGRQLRPGLGDTSRFLRFLGLEH